MALKEVLIKEHLYGGAYSVSAHGRSPDFLSVVAWNVGSQIPISPF